MDRRGRSRTQGGLDSGELAVAICRKQPKTGGGGVACAVPCAIFHLQGFVRPCFVPGAIARRPPLGRYGPVGWRAGAPAFVRAIAAAIRRTRVGDGASVRA
jgi:hypothetical protein